VKTLVIAAGFALAAAAAAKAAGNTSAARCQPHQEDDASLGRCSPLVLASPAAITAVLAEYLTSCGGKAKPEVEQGALRIIERMNYQKWLETVSRVHIVRDKATLDKFCLDARAELNDLLEPIDPHEDKPPPGELDLSLIPR
jgi:hypothetical protein